MNCKKAAQLIPLFVEADLDAAEMQQVTKHLDACNSCRSLAVEFQASQSWLHTAALPAFEEAVFATVRSAVQNEIARPTIADWLTPIWHWKLAFAVSAVLLLWASSFVFWARFRAVPVMSKSQGQITAAATCCSTGSVSDLNLNNSKHVSAPGSGRLRSPCRNRVPAKRVADRHEMPLAMPPASSLEPATPPPVMAFAEPQPETATSESEMLRMEFQTADPNIRIIWLTPKEPTRTNPAADTK